MAFMLITCGQCGHQDDIDLFTSTPVSGDLPKNTYQCPSCFCAIERRATPGEVYQSGQYIPGPIELVPVESRL